ncbi:precorrin-3B C(17)-methyltransferase [Vulcanococcus sp.]|uniref:precorrin-3B C(17)-methyltransferase n=1 Tax=Vulcanococcus sp. TaxID=2856995 RepID=UPI003F6A0452
MSERLNWGFSLSNQALPLLRQLLERGLIDRIASPADGVTWQTGDLQRLLTSEWPRCRAFVAVGSCGAITRLIAPRLSGKDTDPAVVVVDGQGRFAIPLLGGHGAGAEALAIAVAALLGGEAVITGAGASQGRLALDSFGTGWGWRRGPGPWDALMKSSARGAPLQLEHHSGNDRWLQLDGLPCTGTSSERLSVGVERSDHCRWHPPALWVGMGCERNTSLELLERGLSEALAAQGLALEAVAGLASADRKADEPALLELAERHGWPLRCFSSSALHAVEVPNPSPVVEAELGTASVAEAAALLACGPNASLRVQKHIERAAPGEQGAATVAIAQAAKQWAPQRGTLHLIGSGPGSLALLTPDARAALAESSVWVGYGLYLDLLEPLRRPDQLRSDGQLTQERERCREALELACQGLSVALVSSGDSGIYGMAGLALEQWMALANHDRPAFQVHPGLSALQLAAARAGAPLMHDFCTVSLSDRLTPWAVIEQRLQAAADGDFVVALYNPRSKGRDWQLGRAQELLLAQRPGTTPVVLARQLGRPEEAVSLHTLGELPIEQVDMLTLVLIGNSSSRVEGGRMVTPRGYPGAELS